MKRSIYPSIVAGILLTIPLAIYQNFLVPAEIERPAITSDVTEFLSPLPNQIVSMLEDSFLVWLDSKESFSGKIKITDDWGSLLLETPISAEAGESEHNIEVTDSIRKTRGSWLHAEIYSGDELVARQRFGWGLIFLTAGQSNTTNSQCLQCVNGDALKHVMFLHDENTPEAQEPGALSFTQATSQDPMVDGKGKNVWYYVGEKIWKNSQIPVAFINVGSTDTTIQQWLNQLFPRLQYGRFFKISALLWHQGESDAGKITRENYRASLFDLVEQTRREFLYDVPWFVSRASHCGNTSPDAESEIVGAQNDVVSGMGLSDVFTGPNTDSIKHKCHFDTKEELEQYADSWYYELKNSSLLGKILN